MAELTIEQERALALARARQRLANEPPAPGIPPAIQNVPEQPSMAADVAKAIGSGLVTGTEGLLGLPGDATQFFHDAGGAVGRTIARAITGKERPADAPTLSNPVPLPTSADMAAANEALTGFEPYKPKTTIGGYANTIAEFVPGAVTMGGGLVKSLMEGGVKAAAKTAASNALKYAVVPGAAAETAAIGVNKAGFPEAEPYARLLAALAAGGVMAAKSKKALPKVPDTEDLRLASKSLYDAAKAERLLVPHQVFDNAADDIMREALTLGIDRTIHPKAAAALDRLMAAKGIGQDLSDLDTLRQIIGQAARATEPAERFMAGRLLNKFDDFLLNLDPSKVLAAGDPDKAVSLITQARALWKQKVKSEVLDILAERAKNAAGANYSNAGLQTAFRQQFRALANNPRKFAMFSPEEQAAILAVVRGEPVENILRQIGKLAPTSPIAASAGILSGGGAGASLGLALGGPVGAAAGGAIGTAVSPIVGALARGASTRMGLANVDLVNALVRSGKSIRLPSSEMWRLPALGFLYAKESGLPVPPAKTPGAP